MALQGRNATDSIDGIMNARWYIGHAQDSITLIQAPSACLPFPLGTLTLLCETPFNVPLSAVTPVPGAWFRLL